MITMCFLPADIPIKIAGLHFYPLRIIGILALVKLLSNSSRIDTKFNKIDNIFFLLNIIGSLIYVAASKNVTGAIIYKCGTMVDTIVIYIVLRLAIQSPNDLAKLTLTLCYCMLALFPFAFFEYFTANNLFSILGRSSVSLRDGEIRVACTFGHPILFGSFAAALLPMFWAEYKNQKRTIFLYGMVCAIFFVIGSSSSGPIIAAAAGCCFLIFFKWKQHSSLLASSLFVIAIFIHFARESSIWHFIYVRVSIKASSTGYHRYLLTEAAAKEFKNWWLLGYGDIGPNWHELYWPKNHASFTDVTHQYLLEGVRGGLISMIIFIFLCYTATKALGRACIRQKNQNEQWLWWGFTVMMVTQCITFLSVSYFGQITLLFYMNLAIAALAFDKAVIENGKSLKKYHMLRNKNWN